MISPKNTIVIVEPNADWASLLLNGIQSIHHTVIVCSTPDQFRELALHPDPFAAVILGGNDNHLEAVLERAKKSNQLVFVTSNHARAHANAPLVEKGVIHEIMRTGRYVGEEVKRHLTERAGLFERLSAKANTIIAELINTYIQTTVLKSAFETYHANPAAALSAEDLAAVRSIVKRSLHLLTRDERDVLIELAAKKH